MAEPQDMDKLLESGEATTGDQALLEKLLGASAGLSLEFGAAATADPEEEWESQPSHDKVTGNAFTQGNLQDNNTSAGVQEVLRRKKKDELFFLWMRSTLNESDILDDGAGDFGLYPWDGGRVRARGDADARKRKPGDPDGRRANAEDGKRVAVDEDGKRVILDKDGRIATDADGKRIVIGEDGYRLADAGDGSRVVVDAQGRIMNDADGKPLRIYDQAELHITTQADGSRAAVSSDGTSRIAMAAPEVTPLVTGNVPDADAAPDTGRVPDTGIDTGGSPDNRIVVADAVDTDRVAAVPVDDTATIRAVPGEDLDTVRVTAPPAAEIVVDRPVTGVLSDTFAQTNGADTAKFRSFLAQSSGMSLETFQEAVHNAVNGPAMPRGAELDVPRAHLNVDVTRTGRFFRMLMPNGLDLLVMGGVAGTVATIDGAGAGAVEYVTSGGNVLSSIGAAAWAGRDTGAQTLPVYGVYAAERDGRSAEATVRAIEDVVEFVSPFAFAAVGAGGGAAAGGAGGLGIGAIPGAIIGGIGGFLVGSVVSLTASELTRGVARGLGYDDVDRGMIGSWLAPEYADEMEGWIRQISGQGWGANESASQVLERINQSAGSSLERAQNLREFMTRINEGIYDTQKQKLALIADRIAHDTGIEGSENVMAALRLPEARAQIVAFYQQQAAQNPSDQDIRGILTTLAEFEETEKQRINTVAGIAGAELMIARELNEKTGELVNEGGILNRFTTNNATMSGDPAYNAILQELEGVDFTARLRAVQTTLDTASNMNAGDALRNIFANGTDAYTELGANRALVESYMMFVNMEDALHEGQLKFATDNIGMLRQYMRPDAVNKAGFFGIFSSDTTLGADLQSGIRSAGETDPAAQELKTLLAETNNLANVSPEQAVKLLNNSIFSRAFTDIMLDANDGGAMYNLYEQSGFETRGTLIEFARTQRTQLEAMAKERGFTLETGPSADMVAAAAPTPVIRPELAPQPM